MGFNFSFSIGSSAQSAERYTDGSIFYWVNDLLGFRSKAFKSYNHKLKEIQRNPALLKPVIFIADSYSRMRVDQYNGDTLTQQDALYQLAERPNYWQSWTDVFWDLAFFRSLGIQCTYYEPNGTFLVLNPAQIELTASQRKLFQSIALSKYRKDAQFKTEKFKYKQKDGSTLTLDMKYLSVVSDLSGTITGDFFDGGSRLDALYQVARNARIGLESKGENLEFTRKFFASGQNDPANVSTKPMSEGEKEAIETELLSSKKIHATRSKVDIKPMVSDMKKLDLGTSYLADLAISSNLFGVDKSVLGIEDVTYENFQKSFGAFVDYKLMPMAESDCEMFSKIYGLDLRPTFAHLPFNQVFQKDREDVKQTQLANLQTAQSLGVDASIITKEAKTILGL